MWTVLYVLYGSPDVDRRLHMEVESLNTYGTAYVLHQLPL